MLNTFKKLFLVWLIINPNSFGQYREYPIWFLYPKDYKDLIVGIESDSKSSKENAALYSAAYSKCIVNGDLYLFSSDDDFKRQSEYFYEVSPYDFNKKMNSLSVYDCFINSLITNQKICAFTKNDSLNIDIIYINHNKLIIPDWVSKNSYVEANYLYGIGYYTSIGNENEAWLTAEEKAVFSLLKLNKLKLSNLRIQEKNEKDDYLVSVSKYKLRHSLKGLEILERFPDFENKIFYVLCRVEKKNIKALY